MGSRQGYSTCKDTCKDTCKQCTGFNSENNLGALHTNIIAASFYFGGRRKFYSSVRSVA